MLKIEPVSDEIGFIGGASQKESHDPSLREARDRAHAAALDAIEKADIREGDSLEKERITVPPASAITVSKAVKEVGISPGADFAWSVIRLAIAREACGSAKLKELSSEVKKHLTAIDLLLTLNEELISSASKDSHPVSEKMRTLLAELKTYHIEMGEFGDTLSKERVAEIKSQISSQVDKERTALQTTISTEIQPETHNLQAIMNIIQQIIQSDARLKRKTTELPR